MQYLDTSVLVTALTNELATQSLQDWLEAQEASSLHISCWVETEFSSALAMKVRTGRMTPEMRAVSLSDFAFLRKYTLTMIAIKQSHFLAAAKLADNFALGLRAADALHLAVAMDAGATLCTLDRKLADAASAVGAKVCMP
jgi:predicted nucleic acid-binding protein